MKQVLLAVALVLAPTWACDDVHAVQPDIGRSTAKVDRAADNPRLSGVIGPCGVTPPHFTSISSISVTRLIDMRVTNPLGEDIGRITDMIVNDNGCIVDVVITIGGFMGMGGDRVTMPLEKVRIRAGNDSSALEAIVFETRDHILRTYTRRNPAKGGD